MLRRADSGALTELGEQARTMTRQQRQKTECALLQAVVRIERAGELPFVRVKQAGAKVLRARSLPSQAVQMVQHLALRSFQRAEERPVELFQRKPQPGKQLPDGLFTRHKLPCQLFRQKLPFHFRAQVLAATEAIAKLQAISLQQTGNVWLHKDELRAGQHRRHPPQHTSI